MIATKGVSHQRQIVFAPLLRLPDMRKFVKKKALSSNGLATVIVAPEAACRMNMDMPAGRHQHVFGLERKPFAADDPNRIVVDRVAEYGCRQLAFPGGERPEGHARSMTGMRGIARCADIRLHGDGGCLFEAEGKTDPVTRPQHRIEPE